MRTHEADVKIKVTGKTDFANHRLITDTLSFNDGVEYIVYGNE